MLATQTTAISAANDSLDRGVFLREEGFVVKDFTDEEEKAQAYRLRHKVFCEELGWVPRSGRMMEVDRYDRHAVFIGVFNESNDRLVAFFSCWGLASNQEAC